MKLFVVGINHKTAPIEIREEYYLNSIQQELFLSELKSDPHIVEAFVLSTCNRTEVYFHTIQKSLSKADFIKQICKIKKVAYQNDVLDYFYTFSANEAINHLFKVSTGLDSLVLGEQQILGQVKGAFDKAREMGLLFKQFNILSNIAIRVGKKAQNETNIGLGGSSVSWAAIKLAEKVLGTLKNLSVLVIGAGKMSELAVGQIVNRQFKELFLINRTQANAEKLTKKYNGITVPFCDIKETLSKVDLCICSTDAPHYILDYETLAKIQPMIKKERLVLIDISMPRNIDPLVSKLKNVELFYIDDFEKVLEDNMKRRKAAIIEVEELIKNNINEYLKKVVKLNSQEDLLSGTDLLTAQSQSTS